MELEGRLLTLLLAVPVAGGITIALLPEKADKLARGIALFTSLVCFGFAALVGYYFLNDEKPAEGAAIKQQTGKYKLVFEKKWFAAPMPEEGKGIELNFRLGVDGVSLLMILLTAVLTPMCILCSWNSITTGVRSFHVLFLLMEAALFGVFAALDIVFFYVFWEFVLIPMFLLIAGWGGGRRIYSAVKFAIFTLIGSFIMLGGIIYISGRLGSTDMRDFENAQMVFPVTTLNWLFFAFTLAFAIKVPVFPLHTWLPDAHTDAPTAGSVILAGILLKMGTYGMIRFSLPLLSPQSDGIRNAMLALGAFGIVYGALMAMTQGDIKRLIAYSSVSHLGYCVVGIFAGKEGYDGAVLQMVSHGISTGALFILVGIIYDRTHRRGVKDFGGLARSMPHYAVVFLIIVLSSIGLPGLNGFPGELMVLVGSIRVSGILAAAVALGAILSAVYLLRPYRDMFFGEEFQQQKDLNFVEMVSLVPLVMLAFAIGIFPNLVLQFLR